MEGERILQGLKATRSWETTYPSIENYLRPFVKDTQPSLTKKRFLDFEKFSYKLLKLCVEELKKERSIGVVETVLKASSLSVTCLDQCYKVPGHLKSLNFEKLLLHLADGCRQSGYVEECRRTCKVVQERLSPEVANEAVLLQHVFQVLWQASPLRQLPLYSDAVGVSSPILDFLGSLVSLHLPITHLNLPSSSSVSQEARLGKGLPWLCSMACVLSQELYRQRHLSDACQVQEMVCAAAIDYCLVDDISEVHQRAQSVCLLGHLCYLVRICRKLPEPMAIDVLQRRLDSVPVNLLGSEYVGALYAGLARTHLLLALHAPDHCKEESNSSETRLSMESEDEVKEGHTVETEYLQEEGQEWEEVQRNISQDKADPILQMTSELCLSSHEEENVFDYIASVRQTLSGCVRYWEEVWSVAETSSLCVGEVFYKYSGMLEDMYLTGLLAAVHSLPVLVSRVCQVLLRLLEVSGEVLNDEDRQSLQFKVQALRDGFASAGVGEDAEGGKKGGALNGESSIAELSWELVRARVLLLHNQSMLLLISARQLSAELLLLSDGMATEAPPISRSETMWAPTPAELCHVAMTTIWKMFSETGTHLTSMTSHVAWAGLLALLRVIKWTCRLYLVRGSLDKAYRYIREAAMLTKKLQLTYWYCEYLLLLCELYVLRGNHAPSLHLARQLARLLHCRDLADYLAPPTDLPMTTPTASSLLTRGPDSVFDVLLSQRVQTVLLICRAKLMGADGHVTSHVTRLLSALAMVHDALGRINRKLHPDLQSVKDKGGGRGRGPGSKLKSATSRVSEIELVCADIASLRAECHLLLWQPDQAITLLDESIRCVESASSQTKGVTSHRRGVAAQKKGVTCEDHFQLRLIRARLHFLKGKSLAQKINGNHSHLADRETWLQPNPRVRQCWAEFRQCYELCFPVRPVVLLREACLWLALLSESCENVHHYLTASQQISLSHTATQTLSTKIQQVLLEKGQKSSKWRQSESHVSDIRLSLGLSTGTSLVDTPLLKARAICASPCPLPTSAILSQLPWITLTLSLSPKPHPSCSSRLLIAKTSPPISDKRPSARGRGSRKQRTASARASSVSALQVGGAGEVETVLAGVQAVLEEANQTLTITDRKTWWTRRRALDKRMETLLVALGDLAPCEWSGFSHPVLLVLGRGLHHVPWEVLPLLEGVAVTRTPSLTFAAAHVAMVGVSEVWPVDTNSTYFVVNPQGNLKKTEEMFGGRFSKCEGWEGVVGTPPPPGQLRQALETKSLYIYCGHNSGCGLLSDSLKTLDCYAVSLLMGCRSAQLKENGSCDPSGHAHSYLLAGCPALVGCLWTVTDVDLDRFCDGLISLMLSADSAFLPSHVTRSRLKCQLRWLVGASPVVYGLPVVKPRQPEVLAGKKNSP